MTALASPPRVPPRGELPATHVSVRCPIGCDTRLDPARGLTSEHAAWHLRRDGAAALLRALVALHAHHRHVLALVAAGEGASVSNLASDVIDALGDGTPRTLAQIAERVGEREPVVAGALRRLAACGAVRRPRHGRYQLLAGARP